jgi:beta-phosphoglucomutase
VSTTRLARPRAFVFDLDGVITDTAHLHFVAWRELAQGLGLSLDAGFNEQLKGVSRSESLERILARGTQRFSAAEKRQMAERKNAAYLKLLEGMTPADLLPGALEALQASRAAGCRVALASASKNAAMVLDHLGIADAFDHVVDANLIANSKPDPEVFLAAAQALAVEPADCVGIEDAVAGVRAVRAAGMFALGVGDPGVLLEADQVIADLRGFVPSNYLRSGSRLRWVRAP